MRNRIPSFMPSKEIKCPKCGRIERANVDPERLVMCSLCLMRLAFAQEKKDCEAGPWLAVKTRGVRLRRQERTCERCGNLFRGRSNRQRFCEKCQKAAWNDKTRARMERMRRSPSDKSVVTI